MVNYRTLKYSKFFQLLSALTAAAFASG